MKTAVKPPRLARLRQAMERVGTPALLITGAANRRYLSGFTGSSGWLLITPARQRLFTDSRYEEAAAAEAPDFEVVIYRNDQELRELVVVALAGEGIDRLGFEAAQVTFARYRWLSEAIPGTELVPTDNLVEDLRQVKDDEEVARVRRAMALAEQALAEVLPRAAPGRSERDLALELEFAMRRLGAEGVAFDLIVASGPRSSLPHAHPGDRALQKGDLVVFDFGARHAGYCSDVTRTVVVELPDPRQEEVYNVVLEAHLAGLAAVRPGATGDQVDGAARRVIEAAGYGEYFGHGTGHGVGLDVHEAPRLSPGREDVLAEGMLVTIEPGIYLPGWGGVRIEDTVLVTAHGGESLCTTTKELVCI